MSMFFMNVALIKKRQIIMLDKLRDTKILRIRMFRIKILRVTLSFLPNGLLLMSFTEICKDQKALIQSSLTILSKPMLKLQLSRLSQLIKSLTTQSHA